MNLGQSLSTIVFRSRSSAKTVYAVAFVGMVLGPSQGLFSEDKTAAGGYSQPWITVSKETTFVTKPVDQDGYVDYFAALNEKASEGVTVDNNAAVLFAKAGVGFSEFKPGVWERHCEMLGIQPSTDESQHFKPLGELNGKDNTELAKATTEPWSADQFPQFAKWLKSNEKALSLIIEGTLCPRCYIPWIQRTDDPMLLAALLPVQNSSGDIGRCLVARAMLGLNEGRIAEAKQDLLACHRLGRLIGGTPGGISGLKGITIDRSAGLGDAALMRYGKLTAAEALAYHCELRELPPLPHMAEEMNFTERLVLLDALHCLIRSNQVGVIKSRKVLDEKSTADLKTICDESMRVINRGFDKMAAAGREPSAIRMRHSGNVQEEIRETRTLARDRLSELVFKTENKGILHMATPEELEAILSKFREREAVEVGQPAIEVGQGIGAIFLGSMAPALEQLYNTEIRARIRNDLGQLGFALVAYHADHAAYPDTLDALAPKYMARVPKDLYNDRALHFVRTADACLLYSVGANGVDDHGQTFDSEPKGDDIVLQLPHHPVKR